MLKVAVFIIAIVLIYAGAFSVLNIVVPRFMMGSTFNTLTGNALDNIQYAEYLIRLEFGQRIMGVLGLVIVICGFVVLFTGFRKSKKWAWWAFIFAGGIGWLWGLIYQLWGVIYQGIIIAIKSNFIFHAIAIIVLMLGLLVPVGVFFVKDAKKKAEEAETKEL